MDKKLIGYAALEYAENYNVTLNKFEDPTEGAREGLTLAEARDIASEDPFLIWVTVEYRNTSLV